VALTQVFIFAGTATATLLKLKDRHPTRDRPLIYYDVLMQIVSPILLGVSIGVMINPAFPGWLILSLLTLIVIVLVWDVLKRSLTLYRKEKSQNSVKPDEPLDNKSLKSANISSSAGARPVENLEANKENPEEQKEDLPISLPEVIKVHKAQDGEGQEGGASASKSLIEDENAGNNASLSSTEVKPELLRKITTIYQEEKKIIAWAPLTYFIVLAATSIVFSLFKGSSSSKSIVGIKQCSSEYYGLTFSYFIFMIFMSIVASLYLVRKTYVCENTNYIFDEGDIRWNYKKCIIVSTASLFAGIVVGLLGMGGGNLIGPILLSLGVRPEIATISSSFTIFISSGTAAAQYFILGKIDLQYSGWFFMLSITGSLIGILGLRKIAIKKQRVSLLIFCLFFILFASLIIIPTIGILTAIKQSNEGTFQLGFKSLC
jgi:uncharacterized membrane protein YfcA